MGSPSELQVSHYCDACGQPIEKAYTHEPVERFGIILIHRTVQYGELTQILTTQQSVILRNLLLRGKRSTEALIMEAGSEETERSLITSVISRLRTVLHELGTPHTIFPIYGWGYEIRLGNTRGLGLIRKLNWEVVREIRRRHKAGERACDLWRELGRPLGVEYSAVNKVLENRSWVEKKDND